MTGQPWNTTPKWFTAICFAIALPVFALPALLAVSTPEVKPFVIPYAIVTIAACWLAWRCYPQRNILAWVLLAFTLMDHVAIWLLATQQTQ